MPYSPLFYQSGIYVALTQGLAEASTCDLGKVYGLLEQAFLEDRMESDTFLEFMDLIASCYQMANGHGKHSYCAPLVEKYQKEIVKPCFSVLSEKGIDVVAICSSIGITAIVDTAVLEVVRGFGWKV